MSTKSLRLNNKFIISRRGFSLLELLLVLGMIGAIASVILPNLAVTNGSQMSSALREITSTLRSTYDSAVLTGRVHRFVVQPRTGTYWSEEAPLSLLGRPPVAIDEKSEQKTEERARLLEDLNHAAAEPRKASDGKREYGNRSLLVAQRKIFMPLKWTVVDDAMLAKRKLSGAVVFVSVRTPEMSEKLEYVKATEKQTAYIYFFPSGEAQQASLQLALLKDPQTIDDGGPKQTVVLESLTGQSQIVEGFYDVDFK